MSSAIDHAVITWDMARPKLRQDLQFHFQMVDGKPAYILEDRANRGYHQLGVPEYRFLRSLSGTQPAAKLLAECSTGGDALSETEVESLLRWAIDHHLLQSSQSDQADRRLAHTEDQVPQKPAGKLMQFFFFKLPLGSPDGFIRPFVALLGWTLSPLAVFCSFVVFGYGIYLAVSNFTLLTEASTRAFLPQNWLWLLATTIVLKGIHELWHGIATQKYGGVVPEWGLQVVAWISPLTYVDATSSWSFPSRWQRIAVASAGMYIELLIAVAALQLWTMSDAGLMKELEFNVLVSASLVTVVFNANPLMRFDGYYILSDLLDLRNLAQRGQMAFIWLNRRLFFGVKNPPIPATLRKHFFVLLSYGAASWFWRILTSIGLLVLAANLFHGMGLVALVISGLFFTASVLHSSFLAFTSKENTGKIPWRTAAWRIGLASLLVVAALVWIPINPSAPGLAVVEYSDKSVHRAETPGFVSAIHCADGEEVTRGQLLISLTNKDEESRLALLQSQLAVSVAKARSHYLKGALTEWQTEQQKLEGLEEKVAHQQKRVQALEIRAALTGKVNAPDLRHLPGSYFNTGAALLTVLPAEAPQVLISMRQEDFQRIAEELATDPRPFRIRLAGRPAEYTAQLKQVQSKATLAIANPVLASPSGGPLPVRGISQRETAMQQQGLARSVGKFESLTYFETIRPEAQRENMELLQPRFNLYATVPSASGLREGEWGYCSYEGRTTEALGKWIFLKARTYLEERFLTPN
jgi:putative peptide zinc metalloprotease protein